MKAKLNYMVDVLIGVAFLISAGTGILFLFLGSGGYQGGANPAFGTTFLGLSRWVWSDLHAWASMIMIAGVLLHVVLHWKWIVCMTVGSGPNRGPASGARNSAQYEAEIVREAN